MKNMTLVNVAQACGGALHGLKDATGVGAEAVSVAIDSRRAEPGGIFIAVKGGKVDGHDFIPEVAARGALGVVCQHPPKGCPVPYILVEDSLKALREIGEYYRKQLNIKVVGITGSVGKTTTKEFIASVLSVKYKVLKTQGNFNNEIGLPLTVLSIREGHEIAVLEMGISNFGEMHRLSKIARPDICVMTNIGQSHLENLGCREGILKAKSEIFDFMDPEGYVFVNGDDRLLSGMKQKGNHRPVRFGLNPVNDIYAQGVAGKGLLGSQAVIHAGRYVFPVEIPLPGAHMVLNALAAAGVGMLLGLSPEDVRQGIASVEAVGGRSNVLSLPFGTLIDDCYNANPASMKAALDLLASASGRKVAVLGDMFELGENTGQMHGEIGAYAVAKGIDVLACTGRLSRNMYEKARESMPGEKDGYLGKTQAYYFADRDEMLEGLPAILKKGDTVLVKASHGMAFEKVVAFLKDFS